MVGVLLLAILINVVGVAVIPRLDAMVAPRHRQSERLQPSCPNSLSVPHTNVCTIQPQQVGRAVGRGCGCARAS